MRDVIWIRRLALIGAVLCFGVVVLGGYTRLSDSGLGCPDWPGCFGHIAPTGSAEHYASDADVRKAWVEMIHRYFASTLGLIIVVIAALSIRARRERGVSVAFALVLLVLVVLQGMLGMLTVTWLLKPLIVTGHLVGGLTTFAMLLWLWLSKRAEDRPVNGHTVLAGNRLVENGARARLWAGLALAALAVQVALGGWTSSNYAAVACPDLPKCQDQWIPAADYEDAFVLWRGLGINYAGGVLDHPARVRAEHLRVELEAVAQVLRENPHPVQLDRGGLRPDAAARVAERAVTCAHEPAQVATCGAASCDRHGPTFPEPA